MLRNKYNWPITADKQFQISAQKWRKQNKIWVQAEEKK